MCPPVHSAAEVSNPSNSEMVICCLVQEPGEGGGTDS